MKETVKPCRRGPRPAASRLSDAELLGQLLEGERFGADTIRRCGQLLRTTRGLRGLLGATERELEQLPGLGAGDRARLSAARDLFRRRLEDQLRRGAVLGSPADTRDFLRGKLRDRRREIFACVYLDTRHRVVDFEELFQGSIDGACVYPRVVAERALRHGAAAVIVAHNHPSGVAEPSLADQAITRRLKDALALLEIRLLDHFVIGDGEPVSLASRGLL
jgi:DNA repair protein RadC